MAGKGSEGRSEDDARGRKYVERVLRDTVRRVIESGVERISEGPEGLRHFVADMKLPKDIASHILLQMDETKAGLYRIVADEVRNFLEKTDVADELSRALRTVTLEIKTEIRFVPRSDSLATTPGSTAGTHPKAHGGSGSGSDAVESGQARRR